MSRAEDTRFDSWKDISAYLGRDIRTARRWEEERGLPVHRVPGAGRRAVYAYRSEIDTWLLSSTPPRDDKPSAPPPTPVAAPDAPAAVSATPISPWQRFSQRPRWVYASVAAIVLCGLAVSLSGYRFGISASSAAGNADGENRGPSGPTASTGPFTPPPELSSLPTIGQAVIRKEEISLSMPLAKMYFYGLVTDGASSTSPFAEGQYEKAVDSAGQLGAALAYGAVDNNRFDTQAKTHVIGGVSVSGAWDTFEPFAASNQQRGAPFASVNFSVPKDSLVLVIALASGQQHVSITGLQEFITDAWNSGSGTNAMIIGHVYLRAGNYTITENSSASPGQPPENMVDLIGVFVFGLKNRGNGTKAAVSPHTTGNLRVVSEKQCNDPTQRSGSAAPFGAIRIASGTGAFAPIRSSLKSLSVQPGVPLAGTVTLQVSDLAPSFVTVPLIYTPSWGDQKTAWRLISFLKRGESTIQARLDAQAPSEPGKYHILFAFNQEMNGGNVASGTNWAFGQDLWYDGNDIAQFDASQILEAQQFGCTVGTALAVEGYAPAYIPADAMTIEVSPSKEFR